MLGAFAGPAEVEETNVADVGHALVEHRPGGLGLSISVVNEANWCRFDARGLWVLFCHSGKQLVQGVGEVAGGLEADVLGPHAGHRLANGTYGVRH